MEKNMLIKELEDKNMKCLALKQELEIMKKDMKYNKN